MNAAEHLSMPARVPSLAAPAEPSGPVQRWLMEHRVQPVGPESGEEHAKPHAWWKVMTLTGDADHHWARILHAIDPEGHCTDYRAT